MAENNSQQQPRTRKFNMYNNFDISGKLDEIGPKVMASPTFEKREFTVEHVEIYNGDPISNFYKFQLSQAGCAKIDGFQIGDYVNVRFSIGGRKFASKKEGEEGKMIFFNNLNAYKIELVRRVKDANAIQAADATFSEEAGNRGDFYNPSPENVDDLPF